MNASRTLHNTRTAKLTIRRGAFRSVCSLSLLFSLALAVVAAGRTGDKPGAETRSSSTRAPQKIVLEGIEVEFTIDRIGETGDSPADLMEGENAVVNFTPVPTSTRLTSFASGESE